MSKGSLFTEISAVILGIFLIYTIFFVFNHQDEVMHEIMYFSTKEERNLDVNDLEFLNRFNVPEKSSSLDHIYECITLYFVLLKLRIEFVFSHSFYLVVITVLFLIDALLKRRLRHVYRKLPHPIEFKTLLSIDMWLCIVAILLFAGFVLSHSLYEWSILFLLSLIIFTSTRTVIYSPFTYKRPL